MYLYLSLSVSVSLKKKPSNFFSKLLCFFGYLLSLSIYPFEKEPLLYLGCELSGFYTYIYIYLSIYIHTYKQTYLLQNQNKMSNPNSSSPDDVKNTSTSASTISDFLPSLKTPGGEFLSLSFSSHSPPPSCCYATIQSTNSFPPSPKHRIGIFPRRRR